MIDPCAYAIHCMVIGDEKTEMQRKRRWRHRHRPKIDAFLQKIEFLLKFCLKIVFPDSHIFHLYHSNIACFIDLPKKIDANDLFSYRDIRNQMTTPMNR